VLEFGRKSCACRGTKCRDAGVLFFGSFYQPIAERLNVVKR